MSDNSYSPIGKGTFSSSVLINTSLPVSNLSADNTVPFSKVISSKDDQSFLSMSMMVSKERTVFIGDVNIHDTPNSEQLANIASGIASTVKNLGYTPRVALLSFSNFGSLTRPSSENIKQAVNILDERKVDFEFDGEIVKATFTKLAPMSPGGSNSRLAIFKFSEFFNPGSIANLQLKISKQAKGTWVPLKSLSQSDQGLWTIYTIDNNKTVVRDIVEIVHFEDDYAFVSGTIKSGDLVVLGGASKIIEGKKIN